jgi:hypothetical protein
MFQSFSLVANSHHRHLLRDVVQTSILEDHPLQISEDHLHLDVARLFHADLLHTLAEAAETPIPTGLVPDQEVSRARAPQEDTARALDLSPRDRDRHQEDEVADVIALDGMAVVEEEGARVIAATAVMIEAEAGAVIVGIEVDWRDVERNSDVFELQRGVWDVRKIIILRDTNELHLQGTGEVRENPL